ncbi:MAG: response regulator, partial [Deltaproteobacteria bacterium]|nr:response regulator [Deltaproteobacteria bacterium]
GYEVELAADGAEALERFQAAQERLQPFTGVILDLTVPGGMGGRETMERLLALNPDVVSLVSSGYAEDATMTHYQDYGFKGFIKKPYRLEDIGKALHTAISGG